LDECSLRKRLLGTSIACDRDSCALWAQLGLDGEPQCAVKYFKLLDAPGEELAEWLLNLKDEQLAEALGMRKVYPSPERLKAARPVTR